MMAMPSASTAMMNVSRNCPSGIIGFTGDSVTATTSLPGTVDVDGGCTPAAGPPPIASAESAARTSSADGEFAGFHLLGYDPPARTPGIDCTVAAASR